MKRLIFFQLFIIWITVSFYGQSLSRNSKNQHQANLEQAAIFEQAWQAILQRIDWTVQHIEKQHFPMLANNNSGAWETSTNPKWTGGFWVGMLWLAYEKTREAKYLQWARTWNDAILGYEEESNHDRGFVYFYSSVSGYRLIRNKPYQKSAFRAAQKLVDMYQPASKIIPQNLKQPENVIIDTMMNLQLLWWAHTNANPGDPYKELYQEIANAHAEKTMNDFIRKDGSTWQSVHYDTTTGGIQKKHTHQGFADSACWSRGQSWGLYGFMKAFEAACNPDFLSAATTLAEYIIAHLPEDGVPWYDYDDPVNNKDTSAGAIAASAFMQFSKLIKEPDLQVKYENMGKHMLKALISRHLTPFVGKDSPEGILRNGCYQIFKNADSETIWGDYYLMEALAQVVFPDNSN